MSVDVELRALLVASSAITAVVGTRIYPHQRAENSALPAIVYRTILETAYPSLRSEVSMSETQIEYECIASTISQANSLAELVRQTLAGTTGTLGSIPQIAVQHDRSRDLFFDPFDGGPDGTYAVVVEFKVQHRTPALA